MQLNRICYFRDKLSTHLHIFCDFAQNNCMNKKKVWKWVELIAFGLVMIGGLNYLLMGFFGFDFFAAIFGGDTAVVSRIFYSLFGISAAILLADILWQAFMVKNKPEPAAGNKTASQTPKSQSAKTSQGQ